MFYILLKNEWVEHVPDYISQECHRPRVEKTLIGGAQSNLKGRAPAIDSTSKSYVGQVMSRNLMAVDAQDDLEKCFNIMKKNNIHHLIIEKENQFSGLISDRDLSLFSKVPNGDKMPVHAIASTVIMAVSEDAYIGQASLALLKESVSCLPVLNEDLEVSGIITTRDILKVCADYMS